MQNSCPPSVLGEMFPKPGRAESGVEEQSFKRNNKTFRDFYQKYTIKILFCGLGCSDGDSPIVVMMVPEKKKALAKSQLLT